MSARKKTVLVFGTFDLLHPGHIAFLRAAAKYGQLTVVVTPDSRVKTEKGRAALFNERERMTIVAAIKSVTRVVLGEMGKNWTIVRRLKPDIICVGHDQRADHPEFLRQLEGLRKRPRIVRIAARRPTRYSSSRIKMKIGGRSS